MYSSGVANFGDFIYGASAIKLASVVPLVSIDEDIDFISPSLFPIISFATCL